MGNFRFRKTVTLPNGLKMNINKDSVSFTMKDEFGNTITRNPKKEITTTTVKVADGLSYTDVKSTKDNKSKDLKKKDIKEEKIMQLFKIYTDGGFCNTQSKGIGSWAFIVMKYDEKTKEYVELSKDSGKVFDSTNNKMELEAVFQGIAALEKSKSCDPSVDSVEIVSDSMYVVKGSTEWVEKWKNQEWKTLTGKDVKNQDLWMKILKIKDKYKNIKFNWVHGHDNDKYNIECDAMCQAKIREGQQELQNA